MVAPVVDSSVRVALDLSVMYAAMSVMSLAVIWSTFPLEDKVVDASTVKVPVPALTVRAESLVTTTDKPSAVPPFTAACPAATESVPEDITVGLAKEADGWCNSSSSQSTTLACVCGSNNSKHW